MGNLQSMQPRKKWRSNGTTEFVTIDMGSAVACNGLALIGHNLTSAATLRVRGATTAGGVTSAPTVDTTAVSAWPVTGKPADANWPQYLSWVSWNSATLRYWQLDIADAGNAAGYLEAGRLMLGAYWQPTFNFDLGGSPLARDQKDVQVITDYGHVFTDRRNASAPRLFALQISGEDLRSVQDGVGEVMRLRGMWGDVACLLDPSATTDFHRQSMQAVFSTPQVHNLLPQFTVNGPMYSVPLNFREVP